MMERLVVKWGRPLDLGAGIQAVSALNVSEEGSCLITLPMKDSCRMRIVSSIVLMLKNVSLTCEFFMCSSLIFFQGI